MPSVPSIGPRDDGARRPSGPHSMARQRVTMSTPALAAQTWTWCDIATCACGAEMLMMLPLGRRMWE